MSAGTSPLVVDVRSPTAQSLQSMRIPGAIHVPHDQMSQHLDDFQRDREVILYCTCPNEASAAQAAKLLMLHGFITVRPLHGGLDAWIAAGYPVETAAAEGTGIA
jgi:rhodanese-related sulfurtransferase